MFVKPAINRYQIISKPASHQDLNELLICVYVMYQTELKEKQVQIQKYLNILEYI